MLSQLSPSICLKLLLPLPDVRLISSFAIFPPWDCTQRNVILQPKQHIIDSPVLSCAARIFFRSRRHTLWFYNTQRIFDLAFRRLRNSLPASHTVSSAYENHTVCFSCCSARNRVLGCG